MTRGAARSGQLGQLGVGVFLIGSSATPEICIPNKSAAQAAMSPLTSAISRPGRLPQRSSSTPRGNGLTSVVPAAAEGRNRKQVLWNTRLDKYRLGDVSGKLRKQYGIGIVPVLLRIASPCFKTRGSGPVFPYSFHRTLFSWSAYKPGVQHHIGASQRNHGYDDTC
ncbi:hypothetical protein BD310DRAFT_1030259 [Dichomitus squalens]|uniref:Uncharacterized protein n=1 Tax=Dichomitus squalens TaxID=114155 RepID=A0A4Q9Q661_9APHY|nr:hypothetical protein BD310DRAFT_1030259 [Dichomitus squalens]